MLRLRARALTRSDAVDHELRAEMDEHLDQLVAEYVARGMTPEAALEAARREFGSRDPPDGGIARGPRRRVLQHARAGSQLRRPPDAAHAGVRRRRGADHRARHRRDDGDVQRRLRRGAEAAAVRRRRPPRERLDHRAETRPAARVCRDGQRLRLQGAQPRLRGHRGAARRRQLQPHRAGRARAAERHRASPRTCSRSCA